MKKLSGFTFLIIGFVLFGALAIFATTLTHALTSSNDEVEVTDTIRDAMYRTGATSTMPLSIEIAKIGVTAAVQHVGVSKKGNMAVPTNYADVGWYKYGTIPGHIGTAVIAGHFDNGFGKDAVFKRIGELEKGDELIITDQSGKRMTFRVYSKDTISATTSDTTAIFENKKNPLLNLITCEGEWNAETKSYAERTIVYTELIKVE